MPGDPPTYDLDPEPPPRLPVPSLVPESRPPCPKCKYPMKGIQSRRCPECGFNTRPKRERSPCRSCGYALAGLTARECPECGTINTLLPRRETPLQTLSNSNNQKCGAASLVFLAAASLIAAAAQASTHGFWPSLGPCALAVGALGIAMMLVIIVGMCVWAGTGHTLEGVICRAAAASGLTLVVGILVSLPGVPYVAFSSMWIVGTLLIASLFEEDAGEAFEIATAATIIALAIAVFYPSPRPVFLEHLAF